MKAGQKLTALVIVALVAMTGTASALSWDFDDFGTYGPPLSSVVIGREQVDQTKVGQLCDVTIDIGNNESIRYGSTIIVETAQSAQTFEDVEATSGNRPPVTVKMTMGDVLIVELVFGPNAEGYGEREGLAAFSGDGTVTVGECVPPEEPPPTIIVTPPPVVVVNPPPPAAVTVAAKFTG